MESWEMADLWLIVQPEFSPFVCTQHDIVLSITFLLKDACLVQRTRWTDEYV